MNNITSVLEKLNLDINIPDAERVGYSADLSILGLSQETQTILNQCVILHWFDKEIIGHLLVHLSETKIANTIQEISSLTFISKLQYGLAFHQLAREGLLNLYKNQRSNLYIDCAKNVASILSKREDIPSLLEAFYCCVISGRQNDARKLKEQITSNAIRTRGISLDARLLSLQNEAELFPFVMTEQLYDVFIPSNPQNKGWIASDLEPILSRKGIQVVIENIDENSDETNLLNMRILARRSKKILTVVTKDWEEFSTLENTLHEENVLNQSYSNVIPLMIDKREIPKQLENFTSIDFTNNDQKTISWNQLLQVLERKQISESWFYGHHYGDLATFTGRAAELKMLDDWLENEHEALLMIRALGGFGKTALAWTWFNRVDREQWPAAVWWSFYEKESGFESFLAETLKHLGLEVKASARQQVNDLLEAMCRSKLLIVLDGFERLLRQYGRMDAVLQGDDEDPEIDPAQRDCNSPLTESFLRGLSGAGLRSKVLLTTRLCPRVLESADGQLLRGCRDETLSAFSPEDAVAYFHKEGIAATRAEILDACSAYGYHPLSLSLLVGLINADHEHRGDIAAVKNLEIFEDVKAKRHHVLERVYESLPPRHRDLLNNISCFRGSAEYSTIKRVFPSPDLDKALLDLCQRGLLQYAGESQRYDLHPIVRHYAYDHFTDEERRKAHVELANHFIDVMPVMDKKVKMLEDIAPVIELYHHLVRAGNLDDAWALFRDRLASQLLYQFGAYQLQIELLRALFLDGKDKPPRLKNESAQGFTLNILANAYSLSGQPRHAIPLLEMHNSYYEKVGNKKNLANGLGNLAQQQLVIGVLSAAERNLRIQIDLCREVADERSEAVGHQGLGRILSYRGLWQEAEQGLAAGLKLFEKNNEVQSQSVIWSYRALHFLLIARSNPQSSPFALHASAGVANLKSSIECAQHALVLADETARTNYPSPRDYVRARWLLGAAYCAVSTAQRSTTDELTLAEENLSKALNLCRQINNVESEADILLDLARLRYKQGDFQDAQEKASEALVITERSGYVLQGADVNLFLAQYALEQENDKAKAKEYAETALKLATCDGPPYYYKVAYEEAERLLERLK